MSDATRERGRGQTNPVDIVITFVTVVPLLVTAPVWYKLGSLIASEAGPLTSVILTGFLPMLFILVMISAGASAKRRVG